MISTNEAARDVALPRFGEQCDVCNSWEEKCEKEELVKKKNSKVRAYIDQILHPSVSHCRRAVNPRQSVAEHLGLGEEVGGTFGEPGETGPPEIPGSTWGFSGLRDVVAGTFSYGLPYK